jgi:predicted Rossmann fold nucleotide-binding protein DprA/Smf involved in DNA uptake
LNAREQGFLLLTSHLGDPQRKVLTVAQLRNLFLRVQAADAPTQDRELTCEDITALGYDRETAMRILELLSQQEQLDWYVKRGYKAGCIPISRISPQYPVALRKKLGLDCPGCLWAKGDLDLLDKPAVSLVGSRLLKKENTAFAKEVGRQAALQGYVLISGNAKGADQTAQNACLEAGGKVIAIVADALESQPLNDRILYLSEDGFDLPFSGLRALSRNRLIHAMGKITLVAQCNFEKGGTWDGTKHNLKKGYSPVFCFRDGSRGIEALLDRGARPVSVEQLKNLSALQPKQISFL